MAYRVIKRKGFYNQDVYECKEELVPGYYQTMQIHKEESSAWDHWCGTYKRPAIFSTLEEAKTFIENKRESRREEIVLTID